VNNDGGIDLSWYIDTLADINTFYFENSLDGTSYLRKDSVTVTPPPAFLNNYTDATAQTDVQSYYYQVISKDDCAFEKASTRGRTMFLEAELNNNTTASLVWNSFTLENATVINYKVNSVVNGQLIPIVTQGSSETTYEQDIAASTTADGQFCYVIEAEYLLDLPGIVSETLISKSNIACIEREPVIFMPNALVPSGKNNFVKPVLQVPNVKEYSFIIYDRWGKKIFETASINAGWDGTSKGEALPFGTYTYYIKAVSQQGKEIIKKGTVTLVR
jgi:gliding motility-associated-like protein